MREAQSRCHCLIVLLRRTQDKEETSMIKPEMNLMERAKEARLRAGIRLQVPSNT